MYTYITGVITRCGRAFVRESRRPYLPKMASTSGAIRLALGPVPRFAARPALVPQDGPEDPVPS